MLDAAFTPLRYSVPSSSERRATIRTTRDGLTLVFGARRTGYPFTALGRFGAAFSAVRDLFVLFCTAMPDSAAFYGACGATAHGAFALLGAPTVGKSLLSLHLAADGIRFLGDETFTLDVQQFVIQALPRYPALREPALPLLPSDAMRFAVQDSPHYERLPEGRYWFALHPQHLLGTAPDASPQQLRTICFLERSTGQTRIEALQPHETLRRALSRLYDKPRTLDRLARIRAALSGTVGYRVEMGDPFDAARCLRSVLK